MSGDPWLDQYLEESGRTEAPEEEIVVVPPSEPSAKMAWDDNAGGGNVFEPSTMPASTATTNGVSMFPFIPGVSALSGAVSTAGAAATGISKIFSKGASSTASSSAGGMKAVEADYSVSRGGRRRRRRRRLLTAQDKADIAFLHGQLGSGQLGRAAISALLSRRVA